MQLLHFITLSVGIFLVFGGWFLRTRPFWDDRKKYSDSQYNSMWTATGVAVAIGLVCLGITVYGVIKDFIGWQ